MLALSLPYWFQAHPDGEGRGIKTGLAGISTLPDGIQTKEAFDLLVEKFPKAGLEATADIVIEADGVGTPGAHREHRASSRPSTPPRWTRWSPRSPTIPTWEPRRRHQVSADGTVALVSIPLAGEATDSQGEVGGGDDRVAARHLRP